MRKIILGVAVTLDGYIEGPNGEYDWCFTDQDYGMAEFLTGVDAIFYGRKSYEMMTNAEGGTGMDMFGKKEHYVFSQTLQSLPEGVNLVRNIEEVRKMKSAAGKNIWLFGGAILTAALMSEGLVDELWLAVHPLLLGGGKELFTGSDKRVKLQLITSKAYETGLLSLRYDVLNK